MWGESLVGESLGESAVGATACVSLLPAPFLHVNTVASILNYTGLSFLFLGPSGLLGGELPCDPSSELLWLANASAQTLRSLSCLNPAFTDTMEAPLK